MTYRITISPVPETQRTVIDTMAKAHFAEMLPDGPLFYPSALDRYWIERGRHPYVINADGTPIGFALVWNHADGTHQLTEFMIQPAYRHQGIGTEAAHMIFNALGGDWTLGVATHSPGGMEFWAQCLSECENACEITPGPPRTQHQIGSYTFRIER